MTLEQWKERAGFFLEVHMVDNFTAEEICPVGKVHKRATLESPPPVLMLSALALYQGPLVWVRAFEGADSVTVNSWYRSTAYNRSVGGGKKSIHLTAGAADITKFGWTPRRLAFALHFDYPLPDTLGIGLYENHAEPEKSFVHVDVRGLLGRRAPARWSGANTPAGWWK